MTTPASRKRPAIEADLDGERVGGSVSSSSSDHIVGLDVGGRVFYTHLSTLTNAGSSYFEARFGGTFSPGSSPHRDDRGREVYFVDRDGDLFAHVLQFLRSGVESWPPFRQDPVLWRNLRSEAEYYGLESMVEALHVTYSCRPDTCVDRGVLFWLGTDRGNSEYRNPFDIRAVTMGGTFKESTRDKARNVDWETPQRTFVQYRPEVKPGAWGGEDDISCQCDCRLLFCSYHCDRSSLVITLTNVSVRPTHYSLRYEQCEGMDTWDFQASVDGDKWDALHKARGDPHLLEPSEQQRDMLEIRMELGKDIVTKTKVATSFVESELRHTWTLDPAPAVFYRHFRFIGVGKEYFEGRQEGVDYTSQCMHGVGFELFGDVHET